jgi:hypothetical protein
MGEKPSCPEADCGVDICVWSMGSLLDSKTREKREEGGGHRIQTGYLYKVLSTGEKGAESGVKRRQIRGPFHSAVQLREVPPCVSIIQNTGLVRTLAISYLTMVGSEVSLC